MNELKAAPLAKKVSRLRKNSASTPKIDVPIWDRRPSETTKEEYVAFYQHIMVCKATPLHFTHIVDNLEVLPRSRQKSVLIKSPLKAILFVTAPGDDARITVIPEEVPDFDLTEISLCLAGQMEAAVMTMLSDLTGNMLEYENFYNHHKHNILQGIADQHEHNLLKFVLFQTSRQQLGRITLSEYVRMMPNAQDKILFTKGKSNDAERRIPVKAAVDSGELVLYVSEVEEQALLAVGVFSGLPIVDVKGASTIAAGASLREFICYHLGDDSIVIDLKETGTGMPCLAGTTLGGRAHKLIFDCCHPLVVLLADKVDRDKSDVDATSVVNFMIEAGFLARSLENGKDLEVERLSLCSSLINSIQSKVVVVNGVSFNIPIMMSEVLSKVLLVKAKDPVKMPEPKVSKSQDLSSKKAVMGVEGHTDKEKGNAGSTKQSDESGEDPDDGESDDEMENRAILKRLLEYIEDHSAAEYTLDEALKVMGDFYDGEKYEHSVSVEQLREMAVAAFTNPPIRLLKDSAVLAHLAALKGKKPDDPRLVKTGELRRWLTLNGQKLGSKLKTSKLAELAQSVLSDLDTK